MAELPDKTVAKEKHFSFIPLPMQSWLQALLQRP